MLAQRNAVGDMMAALPFTVLIRADFLDRQMQTIKS
jgi:hypothetical protein